MVTSPRPISRFSTQWPFTMISSSLVALASLLLMVCPGFEQSEQSTVTATWAGPGQGGRGQQQGREHRKGPQQGSD
jgi:hypothetical protein